MTPYSSQPAKAFWKSSVSDRSMFDIADLWDPKFQILPETKVATYGSCFAQHIGRALQDRGLNWHRSEAAPAGLKPENARRFNYDVFSSRTGNIYTTSLLRQWTNWALGVETVPGEIWTHGDRFIDPFRPRVEPDGFESKAELLATRQKTIESFRASIERSDVFVFTLGLTERWVNSKHGYEYPMCPGTAGGNFDASLHKFDNLDFARVREDLSHVIQMMRKANPYLKFLLTVSPVPLAATATEEHVLVSTTYSKSVLRAVAGQFAAERSVIDYFPSYEIISNPAFRGGFYEPDLRNVHGLGVDFVMDSFFACQASKFGPLPKMATQKPARNRKREDLVCEEELLAAFGGQK